jgi:NNP family nitrate/nitrite transporter-like MFS transporter
MSTITDDRIARDDESTHVPAARNGHLPTLIACFLHFDLSFMLWVLLGALGIFIAESVGLTPMQKGLVVAVPLLSGSLLRVPAGMLSDRLGAKRVGIALLALLYVPLIVGWTAGDTLPSLLLIGLLLGTAGASFAVALPLASRWYPPEKQGLAMGVAAAGNSGTVITNMIAPTLAAAIGWRNVFAVALIPLTLVLIAFLLLAKESPRDPGSRASTLGFRDLLAALAKRDLWSFCLYYSVTFGGYVGLTSFLPLLLRDQYAMPALTAGYVTAFVALAGSISRPFGGWVADRIGGVRILILALGGISIVYATMSRLPPPVVTIPVLFLGMCCLGLGNGAVFQLVPQRFQREIGTATGVIGAVGGLGGFFLPTLLGAVKQASGSYAAAFMVMATVAGCAALSLRHSAKTRWKAVAYTHQ